MNNLKLFRSESELSASSNNFPHIKTEEGKMRRRERRRMMRIHRNLLFEKRVCEITLRLPLQTSDQLLTGSRRVRVACVEFIIIQKVNDFCASQYRNPAAVELCWLEKRDFFSCVNIDEPKPLSILRSHKLCRNELLLAWRKLSIDAFRNLS